MNRKIPPFRYSFTVDEASFIGDQTRKLIESGEFLTLGRWNSEFEREFREAHSANHAVAVASGTAALEILLRACDVVGRIVVAPSNTFGATLVSIERAGGIPLLVECGEDFSLDPAAVENAIESGRDIAAVVVVHLGGTISPSLPALSELCRRAGVDLVEDAAHATGATFNGQFPGSFGCGAAFSFFSTKVLTAGEGGMILTENENIAEFARLVRDHAKLPDGTMHETAYNWRLSETQALIGTVQVRALHRILHSRARVVDAYTRAVEEAIDGLSGVSILRPAAAAKPNHYKMVIRLPHEARGPVKARLASEFGITMGGEIYATPCHLQRAFAKYAAEPLPTTERLCAGHVCPPVYPDMTPEDTAYTARALARVLREEVTCRDKGN